MKLRTLSLLMAMRRMWIFLPCLALADHDQLLLKHGTYVQEKYDCKEAPFAAMKTWDGIGFAGPHDSKCTTSVLSHHGNQFEISTGCSALGDGTPNPSGRVSVDRLSVIRLSNTSFTISTEAKPKATFRWCGAE